MVNAKIINNKVYCPECNSDNFRMIDYDLYKTNKGRATLFQCKCNRCKIQFGYFTKITLKEDVRFVETILKENKIKTALEMDN